MSAQSLVSKIDKRRDVIKWEIKEFSAIALKDYFINSQVCRFETKEFKGSGTLKWKLSMTRAAAENRIQVELKLDSPLSKTGQQAGWNKGITMHIDLTKGTQEARLPEEMVCLWSLDELKNGIYWKDFINLDTYKSALDKNGTLLINCFIDFFAIKDALLKSIKPLPSTLEDFNEDSAAKAKDDLMVALLANVVPFTDVKLVSSDDQEITGKWAMLAARSHVFASMYESKLKEKSTEVIQLKDMSGATLKVFFHFLYTGILISDWKNDEVIVEMVNAAGVYGFPDLLNFFDGILETVCNEATARKLLPLAEKFSLKKAGEGIMHWRKNKGKRTTPAPEAFLPLMDSAATTSSSLKNHGEVEMAGFLDERSNKNESDECDYCVIRKLQEWNLLDDM